MVEVTVTHRTGCRDLNMILTGEKKKQDG